MKFVLFWSKGLTTNRCIFLLFINKMAAQPIYFVLETIQKKDDPEVHVIVKMVTGNLNRAMLAYDAIEFYKTPFWVLLDKAVTTTTLGSYIPEGVENLEPIAHTDYSDRAELYQEEANVGHAAEEDELDDVTFAMELLDVDSDDSDDENAND